MWVNISAVWILLVSLNRASWRFSRSHYHSQVLRSKCRYNHKQTDCCFYYWNHRLRNWWVIFQVQMYNFLRSKWPQVLFAMMYWVKVKKYREDRNRLMKKIYSDAFFYYLLLLCKLRLVCKCGLRPAQSYTWQPFLCQALLCGSRQLVQFATYLLRRCYRYWHSKIQLVLIFGGSFRMPRYLVSIISCRIIMNIRKYANGNQTPDGVGTIGVGAQTHSISGLYFVNNGQESYINTDLWLHWLSLH